MILPPWTENRQHKRPPWNEKSTPQETTVDEKPTSEKDSVGTSETNQLPYISNLYVGNQFPFSVSIGLRSPKFAIVILNK